MFGYLGDIIFMGESREWAMTAAIYFLTSLGFLIINWEKSEHDLSSLIGSFSWAIPTILLVQAHYRQLQQLFIWHSMFCNYDLSRYPTLYSAVR